MIPALRKQFNTAFNAETYAAYIDAVSNIYPGHLDFRVAETPLFIPKDFEQKMLDTCSHIIDLIRQPGFKERTERAIPPTLYVPNEDEFPDFIAFDFGICTNDRGELEPQLIEMQGFPTLFAWHCMMPAIAADHYLLPEKFSPYLSGYDKASYIQLLSQILIGGADPESVVLLELFPHRQKTRVDFYATKDLVGVNTVCLTEIEQEGKKLYYRNSGKRVEITRIYNRIIFDELLQQPQDVQIKGKIFFEALDVKWIPHPNWFYRVSKFTLPFIEHPYVPHTQFLHEINSLPGDLHNYVLKPLFSFAGQGVIIDVTKEDIEAIQEPQNFILQRKVVYAPIIETPDEPAKAEIRLFYFLPPGGDLPIPVNNLGRLSKGKMIGVRYNKDKSWVGGTFCLFEK